jgi:hypothetical protein
VTLTAAELHDRAIGIARDVKQSGNGDHSQMPLVIATKDRTLATLRDLNETGLAPVDAAMFALDVTLKAGHTIASLYRQPLGEGLAIALDVVLGLVADAVLRSES